MLELPEVLTLSRQLDKELRGRTIASAGRGNSPHKFAFFKPSEEELATVLARKKVDAVKGDGKCILFELRPRASSASPRWTAASCSTRRAPRSRPSTSC